MGGVSREEFLAQVGKVDRFALSVFRNFELLESQGRIVILTPSEEDLLWVREFLEAHFKGMLEEGVLSVSERGSETKPSTPFPSSNLSRRYSFSNFVVGDGNRIAYEICKHVAESPGSGYNPLFLYGNVGLGKTHLLHAVGNVAVSNGFKVVYTSANDFSEEMVEALRSKSIVQFRSKYKGVDFILIDDVQFLSGKDRTQIEFFNIFNFLYLRNKQIILAGDRPPDELSDVSDRLVSRFEGGLVVELGLDEETKRRIIELKLRELGIEPTARVVDYIYEITGSNVRDIEGKVMKFKIEGFKLKPPTPKRSAPNKVELIKKYVASYFNVEVEELSSRKSSRKINRVRHIAIYLCRELTDASMTEIARAFNRKDHSTVINSIKRIMEDSKKDRKLARIVAMLRDKLRKRI